VHPSRNLFWRAACLSLGIHALAFALLVETPVLPRLRADPGGAVQVRLLSPPIAPAAPAATPPEARQQPPTPVVSPPPPPAVKPPPPRPKPRPVVTPKPQPPPAPPAPDPPPAPLLQEGTPPHELPAPAATRAVQGPAPQSSESPTPAGAGAGGLQAGPAGPGADTIAELIRHLEAHRRYPAQARRRGIEGTVGLAFRVAPDGDLLVAEVRQPSGSRLLDRAAVRTLERAFPLPPHLARRLTGEELTINLSFHLVDR